VLEGEELGRWRGGRRCRGLLSVLMNAALRQLTDSIVSVYLGSPVTIQRLITCMLARGHCLIEDVPGVGKTVLATTLAKSIDATFSRIQLTPDLLPSDILGVSVYRKDSERFEFLRGPIFGNIVLADEINRATPRTQTALLEAMNDGAVTIDGVTHLLPRPFMLVATQNPTDFQGTFHLPENQMDRFLMRISVGYPSAGDEARILDLRPGQRVLTNLKAAMSGAEVLGLQEAVDRVVIAQKLREYIVAIASASRAHEDISLGLSPRGALALAQAARATALLDDRDYVIPEDITSNVIVVGAHRIIPRTAGASTGMSMSTNAANDHAARVLQSVLDRVASPV
jgi:MoxR-like ATPase